MSSISLLINNAGVNIKSGLLEAKLGSTVTETFKVNTLGPLLIVQQLLLNDSLKSGSKIINITSRMGSIGDPSTGGAIGYRLSKSALNMVTKVLAIDLKPKGIATLALHPGYIRTGMTNESGEMDPDEAVKRMVKVIDALDVATSGSFLHRDGHVLPY